MDRKPRGNRSFHFEHWQLISLCLAIYDAIAVNAAFYAALWLRYDCKFWAIPAYYIDALRAFAPVYTVFCLLVFWCCKLYKSIWRFAGAHEMYRAAVATLITLVFQVAGTIFQSRVLGTTAQIPRMPITYYCIGITLQFILTIGMRFSYRIILSFKKPAAAGQRKRVMLIGAGAAGQMILRDLNRSETSGDRVCCIIDDNPNKWNRFMEGVPVVGGRNDIFTNVEKYKIDKIVLAIPSATVEEKRDILGICSETDCELKQVSVMYRQMGQIVDANSIKNVSIEDLLGRAPITINMDEVFEFISGKVILVTGGGGSIGSELCRQIAAHAPKTLIIFDIYENNAYDIQQELKINYPDANVVTLIGSIRNVSRLESVFAQYKPDIVYHAAAHKHVPLMEVSPDEAVKNNVVGTWNVARMADKYGVKKFVMISTDKAVNPTNVMGATKRICEMIVQTYNEISKTDFVAVRFGNVLGSNGSVIPLFKRQIEAGGPVTVTDPNIIRYFMTIPEAVSLVLQAGAYAKGGEIFILDMGEPVKIDDLAKNLIRLSGYTLGVNMEIKYTGLRPGEKLYEELLMKEEGLQETDNKLIHIGKPIEFDKENFFDNLEKLKEEAYSETGNIRESLKKVVDTYHPNEH